MLVLGIESTAHTFGAGIIDSSAQSASSASSKNARVLSNEYDKYPSTPAGFIPRKLADHHSNCAKKVLENSLEKAGVRLKEIDLVAYSQGPGIGACLRVGYSAARSLSLLLGKPLIPANHAVAHVEIGKWACRCADPLIVYVSGGNTQIAAKQAKKVGKIFGRGERANAGKKFFYHVFGETLDVGIGNFLDALGRELALSPPDAVGVMKKAGDYVNERGKKGVGPEYFVLPYTVKGMNLAFSGLQTAVLRAAREKKASLGGLCFSAQETAFAMLVEASERALCHTAKREVLLVGGVARNTRLQKMYSLMCAEQGARFAVVPPEYAGDQGAMIALAGLKNYLAGIEFASNEPNQDLRLDSQEIKW